MPLAFESHSLTPSKALEIWQTPFIRFYCRACLSFPSYPHMHSRCRNRMCIAELAIKIRQPFDREFSNAFKKHAFENLRSNGSQLTGCFNATIDFLQRSRAHLKKRVSHQGGIWIPRTYAHNTEVSQFHDAFLAEASRHLQEHALENASNTT